MGDNERKLAGLLMKNLQLLKKLMGENRKSQVVGKKKSSG